MFRAFAVVALLGTFSLGFVVGGSNTDKAVAKCEQESTEIIKAYKQQLDEALAPKE